jgi:PPOX class probable F420-dependent enzyme
MEHSVDASRRPRIMLSIRAAEMRRADRSIAMCSYPAPMDQPSDTTRVGRFVVAARRATLATLDGRGRPRLVPICFVVDQGDGDTGGRLTLYSAIDEKPKRSADPMSLGRVRDIVARPTATVLVDRWDEDWSRLAWVRLDCEAAILPTGRDEADARAEAIAALRAKYPQYRAQDLEDRPLIRLDCRVGARWGNLTNPDGRPAESRPGPGGQPEVVQPDVEAM